jgi:hypothetical protein
MEIDQRAQSDGDTSRVTKSQFFKFLESQFSLADQDKDGAPSAAKNFQRF